MMSSPIIEFKQVCFGYDKTPLLDNVSFEVHRGEMLGIIGPNGEGKTTALKLAMGFLKPQQGAIFIDRKPPSKQRHHIGYVPQSHPYDKKFPISVLEVVLTGAISCANWRGCLPQPLKKRALNLLADLSMLDKIHSPFGSLSGGQAQKVLLARALVNDPSIIFLDEPTAHIDPQSEEAIFHFLSTLPPKKTVITVTHNFDVILRHMTRVLCFQTTVSSLNPKEVCNHFALGLYHPTEAPHDS